ncbi:MAG: hypothetical protein Q4P78_02470 [Rothia sp. (in: high G+C Gram-positive bacteria)]|uniref:hypothetical protein n=1 Tax=Rothia sp. (in: high G+C Gram-positive bacteria) TaxID=1885016 RepID=UPI0026E0F3E8|nr:hypothetical protein [Rothia sp. (in: high G+C Gram-positive bacteria)]MDO5750052.1 hypothetical protein [Rothia sp. (in: high G+C Gram-positive bacteria)]
MSQSPFGPSPLEPQEWADRFYGLHNRQPTAEDYNAAIAAGEVRDPNAPAAFTQSQPAQPAVSPAPAASPSPYSGGYSQPANTGYGAPGYSNAPYNAPGYGGQPPYGAPAAQKNNTGLILGIAGGGAALLLVIVLIVVFAVSSRPSSNTPAAQQSTTSAAPAYTQAPAPATTSPEARPTENSEPPAPRSTPSPSRTTSSPAPQRTTTSAAAPGGSTKDKATMAGTFAAVGTLNNGEKVAIVFHLKADGTCSLDMHSERNGAQVHNMDVLATCDWSFISDYIFVSGRWQSDGSGTAKPFVERLTIVDKDTLKNKENPNIEYKRIDEVRG